MKPIAIAGLLLLLAACASHDVHCDGRLHPIGKVAAPDGANGSDAQPR
jgi:hypothetical protein